ncbi:hypothetical protein BJ684DRAFT_18430 [Piptocephalis cylindrospora]|uniref:Uncharacterized protein n=1 Tax=Piptocephalis cylindrospora TaxID=1907219 RepID=A0A4P9YAV5_9FUNG|nr:hypothetical protein BJ684DRAFT_18430 [Piptocephalis cylindrospora]|eukprot:RKP15240.1 hypothetical protein BJ684DRAFT_18430 [Piptocephalis cylindrospora]
MLPSSLSLLSILYGLASLHWVSQADAASDIFCRDQKTFIVTLFRQSTQCPVGSSLVTQVICRDEASGTLVAAVHKACPLQSSSVYQQDFECLDTSGNPTFDCQIGYVLARLYCYDATSHTVSYTSSTIPSCPASSSRLSASAVLCMDPSNQVSVQLVQGACPSPAIPVHSHDYQCVSQGSARSSCPAGSRLTATFNPSATSFSSASPLPSFSATPAPNLNTPTGRNSQVFNNVNNGNSVNNGKNVINGNNNVSNDNNVNNGDSSSPSTSNRRSGSSDAVYCKDEKSLQVTEVTTGATCQAGSTQTSFDKIVCIQPQQQSFSGTLEQGCPQGSALVVGEDYLCLDQQGFPIWSDCSVGDKIVPYSTMLGPSSYCKDLTKGTLTAVPALGVCAQGTTIVASSQVVCINFQNSFFDGLPLPRCRSNCIPVDMSDYQPVDGQGNPLKQNVDIGTRLVSVHQDSSQSGTSTGQSNNGDSGQQVTQGQGNRIYCESVTQNITVVTAPTCLNPMDVLLPGNNVGCAKKDEIRLAEPVNRDCPPGTRYINMPEWSCAPGELNDQGICPFGARLLPAAAAYSGTSFCESARGNVTMVQDAYSCEDNTQLINDLGLVGCRDLTSSTIVEVDPQTKNCPASAEPIDFTWWECAQKGTNQFIPAYKCDFNSKVDKIQPLKRIVALQQYIDTVPVEDQGLS